MVSCTFLKLAVSLTAAACGSSVIAQPVLTAIGQSPVTLPSTGINELSGITYLGGDQYIVVSDGQSRLAPLTIQIDPATGQITSTSLGTPLSLAGVSDLEAVAYDPRDASVLIAAEANQTITRFNPDNGSVLGTIDVPAVFSNARGNFGLESLSLNPIGYDLWTANEEALNGDGPLSTDSAGTLVRLQHFDSTGDPTGQFAYLTDPHTGSNNILNRAQSGVADLLALPSGDLLVLERTLGGAFIPTLRNRIYLVDYDSATDTSDLETLDGESYTPVTKTQLIQVNAANANYEGIALGPRLDNGDYAVILVSDDGANSAQNPQQLLTLRLSGIALPGDLTGDFAVDQDDLNIVLGAWNQSVTPGRWLSGDPSGDGTVNLDDLRVVLTGWTSEEEAVVTIPEPGASAAWLTSLVYCMTRRR